MSDFERREMVNVLLREGSSKQGCLEGGGRREVEREEGGEGWRRGGEKS